MKNNRDYKNFSAGSFYHVYNRGTAKGLIFLDNEDFCFFLNRLNEALSSSSENRTRRNPYARTLLPPGSFQLVCYCLMPNHYHLLIKQNSDVPISKLMIKICTSYSKYFNKKYNRIGTLFQDRFKAVYVKSDEQFVHLISYIHMNPVRAGLVTDSNDYPYSSCGKSAILRVDGRHQTNI